MKKNSLLAALVCLAFSTVCLSATIHVPADHPTIKGAIAAAGYGDTVLVAPGTYHEYGIDVDDKRVHIISSNGPEVTVIDANHQYYILQFSGWHVKDSTVKGFTLTHGRNGIAHGGGAISCFECKVLIEDNIIMNCENLWGGGGGGAILCSYASPIIKKNIIRDNSAHSGGAIYCYGGASVPRIFNNWILNNHANDFSGGGIRARLEAYPIIHENVIMGNTVDNDGGGISIYYANADIVRNTVAENAAGQSGGGMDCGPVSDLKIVNNIVYGNNAIYGGGIHIHSCFEPDPPIMHNTIYGNTASSQGGGMRCTGVHTQIYNTILWNNSSPGGKEMYVKDDLTSDIGIHYSNVQGGLSSVLLEGYEPELTWGAGMIDSDPLFVDSGTGDLHLTYPSPCRNTGESSVVTELTDFEGDLRRAYGMVDMGADEFYTHFYCVGDFTPGGSIEGKLVGLPGTAPTGIFFGSGVLAPPIQHKWGAFHLEAPWFAVPLGLAMDADGVLEIPTTLPLIPVAPYDIFMQALIGVTAESLTNLFVLEVK